MSDYALELTNLSKAFDSKMAVDNFSLQMKQGEILGLLGPNGAGKTTSIRMIMNIIAPDSGEIKVLGEKFSEKTKDRIGYLPEERGLYRKLGVFETLNFFGQLKGMKKSAIRKSGENLLEVFELSAYKDKKVEELSKGMAQKLQFIISIIHSPELLILDEPFSGLDPINIELVKNIILQKKREGITIIFSTHLMDFAEKIVDSVVMINNGKKVLDGSLTKVKSGFGANFVKVRYEGDASFIAGLDFVKGCKDYGNEIEIELTNMSFKEKLLLELIAKLSVNGFEVSEPSLNNIFISKVKE